jgi:hypothetical protein
MGLLSRLEATAEKLIHRADLLRDERDNERATRHQARLDRPVQPRKGDPAALTTDDVDAFLIASGQASAQPPPRQRKTRPQPGDVNEFLTFVRKRDPHRLHRLGRDLDWLRREANRFGIDPEEIRWLL